MAEDLTYTNIETRVMNMLRIPTSDTTQQTRIAAIINEVYRDVFMAKDWWWALDRQVINTVADYATGTVSVSNGSTTATLSTAPTGLGSFANRVILVSGNTTDPGAVYRIASHTANSTTVTLDAAYTGQTDTAASFAIYQDSYDLAAEVGKVINVKRYGYRVPISKLGPNEMHDLKSWSTTVGRPQAWSIINFDTSGDPTTQRQLVLHPYPDDTYRVEVHYKQALNTLSGSTKPLIPDEFRHVLIYLALGTAYPVMLNDVERGSYYEQKGQAVLARMNQAVEELAQDLPQMIPSNDYRRYYDRGRRLTPANADLGTAFGPYPWGR